MPFFQTLFSLSLLLLTHHLIISSTPTSVPSSSLSSTRAAILYGPLISFERSHPSILSNIVHAEEGTDIFYAGPLHHDAEERLFSAFGSAVKVVRVQPQPPFSYFVKLLQNMTDIDYYSTWTKYSNALSGITNASTGTEGYNGGNIYTLYWQSLAFQEMIKYEKGIRKGLKYTWVVSVRPDMEFVLPLPSNRVLHLASSQRMPKNRTRALFFMNNHQNYRGVSDRFGILSRAAATFYFLRFNFILSGSFSEMVNRKSCDGCNSERMLDMWMDATNTTKISLPGFGALLCPLPSERHLGVGGAPSCMVNGFAYKYDDNNPSGEPNVMHRAKLRFKGWSEYFKLPA